MSDLGNLEAEIVAAILRVFESAVTQPDPLAAARAAARTEAHRIAFEHAAAAALDVENAVLP